jgi:galactofuranose transport system permease protein
MARLDTATTPPAPTTAVAGRAGRPAWWRNFGQKYGALAACIVLLLLNCFLTPHFLSFRTLGINLQQMSTTTIVAIGMTLVIGTGGIDLSVGSLMAIAGVVGPLVFLHTANPVLGLLLSFLVPLAAMALCGLFNGWLVTRFDIQPIIATLILFIAGRGIAQVLTNGAAQVISSPSFGWIGGGSILGLPVQAYLMLILVAIFALIMAKTTFGRYIQATGGNKEAARLAGIPVKRTTIATYVIVALLAGLAGLIVVSLNADADPSTIGLNVELAAIAAVAIGGTPLMGGQAKVVGTLLGALIVQLIYTALVGNNVPDPVAQVVNAAIILGAVALQRQRQY